jgi:SPP1 family predicted phage head-tail adaptor
VRWPAGNPGDYLHEITILRPVDTVGSSGPKTTYEPFVRARAKIEPLTATDVIASGQTVSELGLPVTIPYQAGIESNMRVLAAGGTYTIKEIQDVLEMHVTLILTCIAIKGNQ